MHSVAFNLLTSDEALHCVTELRPIQTRAINRLTNYVKEADKLTGFGPTVLYKLD